MTCLNNEKNTFAYVFKQLQSSHDRAKNVPAAARNSNA